MALEVTLSPATAGEGRGEGRVAVERNLPSASLTLPLNPERAWRVEGSGRGYLFLRILAIALGLFAIVKSAGAGEAPYGGASPVSCLKLTLADVGHVLSAPVRWDGQDWLVFGGLALGVAAAYTADAPIRDAARRSQDKSAGRSLTVVEQLGSWGGFGVIGGIYAAGLVSGKSGLMDAGFDALVSVGIAGGIITPAIKYSVGRSRPWKDEGIHKFRPFSGNVSFPSGHTTQAFAIASVVAESSESVWLGGVSYALAATVGAARIYHDAHFASDVLAGAVIGTATGVAVVRYNRERRARAEPAAVQFVPLYVMGTPAAAVAINY